MLALTISAVDHTTGNLTATAHGRSPGDGPGALLPSSSAGLALTGVVPTGLAALIDYWIIVVDANTIRLASSSANALANIPVAFSTNGTLPLLLVLGIPARRATTYVPTVGLVPGTQVKSADLNSFEDFDTVIFNLLTGQAQSVFSAVTFGVDRKHGNETRSLPAIGSSTAGWGGGPKPLSTGAGNLVIPIPMLVGDRLQSVSFVMEGNGTVNMTTNIFKQTSAVASDVSVGSVTQSSVPASDVPKTCTVTSPVANTGESMYLNVNANGAGLTIAAITYVLDRP